MIPPLSWKIADTAKYLLLEEGDVINDTDEYYNNFKDEWLPVEEEFWGNELRFDESKPVRRKNPIYDPEAKLNGA
jgi:hypothetical protein